MSSTYLPPITDEEMDAIKNMSININGNTVPYNSGNVTISTSGSGYNGSWLTSSATANTAFGYTSSPYTIGASTNNTIDIRGDGADININGKSLVKFMEAMEQRLAIICPNLEKLEHFAALRKAYDHYKMLEQLCELPAKEDENK